MQSSSALTFSSEKVKQVLPIMVRNIQSSSCLLLYFDKDGKKSQIRHIPFAVFPYKISQSKYNSLKQTQRIWSKLFVKLSQDKQFLNNTLARASKEDPFMKELLRIYNEVQNPQKIQIVVARNDYMLDHQKNIFLMVEYNLMAVGLVYASDKLQTVQRNILSSYFPDIYSHQGFPRFESADTFCDSIIQTIKLAGLTGKIILVCQEVENNIYDQGLVEYGMVRRGKGVTRATFRELHEKLKLDEGTLNIEYDGEPVALFYFREGWKPASYKSSDSWEVRQMIQKSRALKVPTVAMQIVNAKRIQQQLYSKEVLLRYLEQEEAGKIHREMAAMYNFQSADSFQSIIQKIDPSNIIVKPNREGGNNNLFGAQAVTYLESLSQEEREQYILMEKIRPEGTRNVFVKGGVGQEEEKTVCEVSMNNVFIHDGGELVESYFCGGLMRSKNIETLEGGVSAEASVVTGIYVEKE